jgi:hypothetical protein
MTIQNREAFIASQWDWAVFDGCFGDTRIHPTDVDGLVERNGKFLFLETKLPGTAIKMGQEIMLKNLASQKNFTVLVIWGRPGMPVKVRIISDNFDKIIETANLNELRRIVKKWFSYAENQKVAA